MASLERDLRELDALRNRGVITPEEYEVRRAALMAAPPAPPRPRGNVVLEVFKWGSVGCLVVIGVGFLVSVLLVIAMLIAVVYAWANLRQSRPEVGSRPTQPAPGR